MQTTDPSERKWHLAAKVLTSGLDAAEAVEWEEYLSDAQFKLEFDAVKRNWEAFGSLPYQQINIQDDWRRVQRRMSADTSKRGWASGLIRYAAVLLIAIGIAYYVGQHPKDNYTSRVTVIDAPAGTRTAVTLPDSSKVWLNADSKIFFDAGFGFTNRNITLEGEAFFDVVKEKTPFSIHTTAYDITVLGTAFNVKAYADDDEAVTTLVRGSLRVERVVASAKREQIILKPNEKVSLTKANGSSFVVKRDVDAENEVAWKDGWLSVRGESLNDLARKIERLYDVRIDFQEQELQRYRYTGRIRLLSLEQVLKALSLTSPVEFSINEKAVILRENKKTKESYQSLQTP